MLATLSSSHGPQLTVVLVACGALFLIAPDHRMAVAAFLAQRFVALVLVWPLLNLAQAYAATLAWLAVALLCGLGEWRVWRGRASSQTGPTGPFGMNAPFRALAVCLGLLTAYGFAQTYSFTWLPRGVAFMVAWLIAVSLLAMLFANSGLGVGLAVLTFADGCRILYGLWQPDLLLWALWCTCDVLVVLAGSYVRQVQATA